MNYENLLKKRDQYQAGIDHIPEYALQSFEQAFEVEYAHNSTAIEGNTLTLMETKLVLEDGYYTLKATDGRTYTIPEDVEISPFRTRNIVTLADLTAGRAALF